MSISLGFPPASEWQTMTLGPYPHINPDTGLVDPYFWTFPILPQVASGHTKTFPPRSTLGPTEPDIDDTLSTANWVDLTGGQGIAIINPATDMGRTWWHTSDCRHTDGITNPPEVTSGRPEGASGDCTPVGTIGEHAYALWGSELFRWVPESRTWVANDPVRDIGPVEGPGVAFDGRMYWPTLTGYTSIAEHDAPTATDVLTAPVPITGAAAPLPPPPDPDPEDDIPPDPPPHTVPIVWRFGVYDQMLYAITRREDHYTLCFLIPSIGDAGEWQWPFFVPTQSYCTMERGITPTQLISWVDALGQGPALWAITDAGCLRYNPHDFSWEQTTLWNVPPHPNWGRCATPFRPGEALWIASGGGDLTQYSASGVVVPASGPGGRGAGMPVDKRGDIVSMTSDLANLYCLVQGDPAVASTTEIEDTEGADPLYLSSTSSVTTVIASTGKGWHPLWEASGAVTGLPTEIVVGKTRRDDDKWDFTCFWGIGGYAYAMPCRLTSYSAAQGRTRGIDRFAPTSYIELGEFYAGSINAKKLWSHAALKLKFGMPGVSGVELAYSTDADESLTVLGYSDVSHERIVLPFGLLGSPDPLWSAGLASYWIKPRMRLYGTGGVQTPVLQALSLSYLPLRMDASHAVFTIPLPVEVDERSGKTAEQIHHLIHHLLHDEVFHHLRFGAEDFRVVISGASHTEIAGQDFVGAIKLNVIQIPTGLPGLIGEVE